MELKDNNEIRDEAVSKKKFDGSMITNNPVFSFFKRKWKLLVFLAILIFAVITASQVNSAVEASKTAGQENEQSFEKVESKDISKSISVTGSIVSNESRTLSTLVAKTEVLDVMVEVGDYVKEGDTICVFDTTTIEDNIEKLERQIQVNNAKATLALAKANTQVAWAWEDYFDNQADGQMDLNASMIAYQQQQNNVADAISSLEDKERALDEARDIYHDYKKAKRDGTVSENSKLSESKDRSDYQEDIRDAEEAVSSASRSLQNAELSLQNTINSYNQTVEKLRDQGRTDLRTISSNMASVVETQLNNMTTNDEAEEKIRDYEDSLENCTIKAPISGIVTSVSVVEGDEYEEKSTICVIQDDSSYKVSGTVDQYDVSEITESMNCIIKTDATGDDQMEGILTFVSPVPSSSSSSSGTSGSSTASTSSSSSTEYPIEITIKGRDDRLRIGMTAEASILVEARKGVKTVPYDAIEEDSDGGFYVNVASNFDEKPSISGDGISGGAPSGKDFSDMKGQEGTPSGKDFSDMKGQEGAPSERDFSGRGHAGEAAKTSYSGNPIANLIAEKMIGRTAAELYAEAEGRPTKRVSVEKGLESDFYTEIISDDIEIGDEVLIPDSESSDSDSDIFAGGPGHGGPRGF